MVWCDLGEGGFLALNGDGRPCLLLLLLSVSFVYTALKFVFCIMSQRSASTSLEFAVISGLSAHAMTLFLPVESTAVLFLSLFFVYVLTCNS